MKKSLVLLIGLLFSINVAFATRYVTTYSPGRPAYNPSIYNSHFHNPRSYRGNYHRHPRPIYDRPYDNPRYRNRYGYNSINIGGTGSLFNRISTFFTGTPTGVTPQVNPYWDDDTKNENGKQFDYEGTNGWFHHDEQIGSSTGVHIID